MTAELIGGPHDGTLIEMAYEQPPFIVVKPDIHFYRLEGGQEFLEASEPRKYLFDANAEAEFGL